jgi:hypothetical protein
MIAHQHTTNADYYLAYRGPVESPRYFNADGRETQPRKRVDHASLGKVRELVARGGFDGIALVKDGQAVDHWAGVEPPADPEPETEPVEPVPQASTEPPAPASEPSRPAVTAEDFADLPEQMRAAKRWLVWKSKPKDDPTKKPGKVPHYVSGKPRSGSLDGPDDVVALASFDEAIQALQSGHYTGLGFALGPDGNGGCWQGIDLDDVPARPELQHLADNLPGYTEDSPSGQGKHAYGYGRAFMAMGSNASGIEAYAGGRFFTVTAEGAGLHPLCDLADFVENELRPAHGRGQATVAQALGMPCITEVDPTTITELRSALLAMRADDRDLWVRMGLALKTLGEVGRGLWLEWSPTSEKFGAADASRTWESFKPTGIGHKAVFAEAQRRGWLNPLSKEATQAPRSDFPVMGEATPANGLREGQEAQGAATDEPWPDPVDPFAEHVAPQFPVNHLPEVLAKYCHEKSAQTGFDAGGYGFALLVAASNLIDHRARLQLGPLSAPPFLWGAFVASAGAGKSPVLGAALQFARRVNDELLSASIQERDAFASKTAGMSVKVREQEAIASPPWRQLMASDTTVEALTELLRDNPSGIFLAFDELAEFIGRMDAYNGGTGKDRATYLQAYDGGPWTTNRKGAPPLHCENFSVGVLTGVQPGRLAEMFRKGGADGLLQRFLVYALPRAGRVNYATPLGTFTEFNCGQVFNQLHEWSTGDWMKILTVEPAVLPLMEEYHQNMRVVAERTASDRLGEHIDKFPGFLARILLALHCIECAAQGRFKPEVNVQTFNRALAIVRVLYFHSEAVYKAQGGASYKLMESACEAILSKGWTAFKWGDLTRNATGWQDADDRQLHGAVDLLIELGWVRQIVPTKVPGRPGRRSNGSFVVNPAAHSCFEERSSRIVKERAARHAAIQAVAATRSSNPWE